MGFKIYYSVSIRGSHTPKKTIQDQISFLESLGEVLTKHMASDDVKVVDMGKSDSDIFKADDELLKSADLVIAECTNPSLGVGFMIARALMYGKKILCVYQPETKLSAMINGCDQIEKRSYKNFNEFQTIMQFFVIDCKVQSGSSSPSKSPIGSPSSSPPNCPPTSPQLTSSPKGRRRVLSFTMFQSRKAIKEESVAEESIREESVTKVQSISLNKSDLMENFHSQNVRSEPIKFVPLKIYLFGPPGAGKSTAASELSKTYGFVNISTGDIMRNLVKDDTNPLTEIVKSYMNEGKLVPREIMRDIVVPRLCQEDCSSKGFVLDGYPLTYEECCDLTVADIRPDFVFYFECSDQTSINRQCGRGQRVTDTKEKAVVRTEGFRAVPELNTLRKSWFKNSSVIRVNAECDQISVTKFLTNIISNYSNPPTHSYFPIEPVQLYGDAKTTLKSSRFHLHIDAPDHQALQRIFWKIYQRYPHAQGQIKIYPIRLLELGCQVKQLSFTYGGMMNFHPITEGSNEAFITGRMGNEMDYNFLMSVLTTIRESNEKIMTEIEQYVGEWELRGSEIITETEYNPIHVDMTPFKKFDANANIIVPPMELHLGFNLPVKTDGSIPIPLPDLVQACKAAGLNNGGWFVFGAGSYRSNEFTNECNLMTNKKILIEQAFKLQTILKMFGFSNVNIMFSLEYVHGIWQF
jgi:adenylate kinase family enzyme